MASDLERFDALGWVEQVHVVALGEPDMALMDHVAAAGDVAVRMALANRPDVPDAVRSRLAVDGNPVVRALASGVRVDCSSFARPLFSALR